MKTFGRRLFQKKSLLFCWILFGGMMVPEAKAQPAAAPVPWIRPNDAKSPAVWGIHNGIVVSLWPYPVENGKLGADGGPRGLLRIGYEYEGIVYLINYIAVEPVVNGKMEFSEISPSRADGKWGKFFWASDTSVAGAFFPAALCRGKIDHPDPAHPETEELSLYVFMEQFLNGAWPYLKLSIRSDRPEELGLQIFDQPGSAVMERCVLTATMGNYSRLRRLFLKDQVVQSEKLFAGFDGIDFIEKKPYPASAMLRNKKADYVAVAETNESFAELAAWPQQAGYLARWGWRYRPFYKLTQYWRTASEAADSSLEVRVNGRAKYWSGGSADKKNYIDIPGGPAFENFELRKDYHSGQIFYFGLSRKTAKDLISDF
jgi:hypothetical protein